MFIRFQPWTSGLRWDITFHGHVIFIVISVPPAVVVPDVAQPAQTVAVLGIIRVIDLEGVIVVDRHFAGRRRRGRDPEGFQTDLVVGGGLRVGTPAGTGPHEGRLHVAPTEVVEVGVVVGVVPVVPEVGRLRGGHRLRVLAARPAGERGEGPAALSAYASDVGKGQGGQYPVVHATGRPTRARTAHPAGPGPVAPVAEVPAYD